MASLESRNEQFNSWVERTPGRVIAGFWRAALASLVKRWIAQIRSEWQVHRGIDALLTLDDRMLAAFAIALRDLKPKAEGKELCQ